MNLAADGADRNRLFRGTRYGDGEDCCIATSITMLDRIAHRCDNGLSSEQVIKIMVGIEEIRSVGLDCKATATGSRDADRDVGR